MLLDQLAKSQVTIANAESANSKIKFNKWVSKRVSNLVEFFVSMSYTSNSELPFNQKNLLQKFHQKVVTKLRQFLL